MPVTQPSSTHAHHDVLLIAKLAANDTTSPERVRANAHVAACHDCADLLRDLHAIQIATQALPAPVRLRDFRLTGADAARHRPRSWRTWLERLAAPRFAYTQRVGAGLAALGIAGLLFASLPSGFVGGTVSTSVPFAGAPLGTIGAAPKPASDTASAGSSVAVSDKSAPSDQVQPPVAGNTGSAESAAGDQTPGPSARDGAAPVPVPSAALTAPQPGGTFSAQAGSLPAESGPAAPDGTPSLQIGVNLASPGLAESAGPAAAVQAPTTAVPSAPAGSPAPAPTATGPARAVPQGVSPTAGRSVGGSDTSGGLSPLGLVSFVLVLLGLGLLLARRVAVSLTSR